VHGDATCWLARTITATWQRRAATKTPWPSRWPGCATMIGTATEQEGVRYEPGTGAGRHAKGGVRRDVGRNARTLGRQRAPLRGLGDLPPQGLSRRPESAVRVAVEQLVRAGDPALQRRRQDVADGGQQARVRGRPRHAPPGRRHAASLGVLAGLASRAIADRSRYRLRRRPGRRAVPLG